MHGRHLIVLAAVAFMCWGCQGTEPPESGEQANEPQQQSTGDSAVAAAGNSQAAGVKAAPEPVDIGPMRTPPVSVTSPQQADAGDSFYSRPPLFAFRPKINRQGSVDRFGPVGIGIELHPPAFVMKIKNVEEGSPAAKTGKLKKGQIIETINGQKLHDIDPRIQLGDIIYDAEASDGIVKLVVRDEPGDATQEVIVKIPVLGPYNATWPLNCAKSDKIVRGLADYLAQRETFELSHGQGPAMLFMLSTGEEKDLDVVRRWVRQLVEEYKDVKQLHAHNWTVGYAGIPLCEYYLRTGDESVIHLIELIADKARWDMYNDGWAHGTYQGQKDRSKARMAFPYMGGGHINTCGVHVVTFLLMAKECGAKVDDSTLLRSLRHFFRYASRGNVPYGDQIPEQSFVDNGKTGGLAFTMSAAESLTRGGEDSLYAQARDSSAVKGFYSTSWMMIGHTGGGVGEIWRSASMGLMYDKAPTKYREFMDNRRWFYELSRRYDGSFGIVGGGRYDQPESWGVAMGLTYTMPRKTLRLSGAPRTQYSKQYKLPERPWGNVADDTFYSSTPATMPDGSVPDISDETLLTSSSRAIFDTMSPDDVDDSVLLRFAHHPDHGIRRGAASFIHKHRRYHLIPVLLRSKDPRVRHAGTMVVYCVFKRRPMKTEDITDEVAGLLGAMIEDPDEAMWGQYNAMKALALVRPELIEPHVDRLLEFLKSDGWWMSEAAMAPLARVAGDSKYYRKILPAVAEVMTGDTHLSRVSAAGRLFAGLKNASPEVKQLALEVLREAYVDFPAHSEIHGPDKITMEGAVGYVLFLIGGDLAQLPGGADALFDVATKRFPDAKLPHSSLFVKQKPDQFGPELEEAIKAFKESGEKPTRW